MNDSGTVEDEVDETGPQAGERLAAARLALDISIADIAKALHLDDDKVTALEANDFESLGPPVFAKGHMLKYAELVGVPADEMLADYYALNRAVTAPPVVGPKRDRAREFSPGPWIGGTVVILLVASAVWWWFSPAEDTESGDPAAGPSQDTTLRAPQPEIVAAPREQAETAPETPAVTVAVPEPIETETGSAPDLAGTDSDAAAGTETEPAPESVPQPELVNNDTAIGSEVGGSMDIDVPVQLRMVFSGDCWTEVTDADGRQLYFDLGSAGRVVTVTGEAPLRVLFGDSTNVSIAVDGNDFAIPPSNRRDNTVRLTLNSQ